MTTAKNKSFILQPRGGIGSWLRSGEPMIWANAAAVSISIIAVLGLLLLLAVRGLAHFWPQDILLANQLSGGEIRPVMGEYVEHEQVSAEQLRSAGVELLGEGPFFTRTLIKRGNRDFFGSDFVWILEEQCGFTAIK